MNYALALVLLAFLIISASVHAEVAQSDVDQTILIYALSLQARHDASLRAVLWFRDAEEEKQFQSILDKDRTGSYESQWKDADGLIRAWSPKEGITGQYMYLFKTKKGYVPKEYVIRQNENGDPVIDFSSTELADIDVNSEGKVSPVASAIKKIESHIDAWKELHGESLKNRVTMYRTSLHAQIAAIKMANEKEINIINGYGTVQDREDILNDIQVLSDLEVRDYMIQKLSEALRETLGS